MELLCQKGYYPYEWVNGVDKLDHKGLPPKDFFYLSLKQETISVDECKHAQNVYKQLNCKTFKDYHMTYLKCDVLLLADVFENFRKTCITYYKLDPANYLTAPGLAWD
ncbi:MAG: DNA polymerase, partial [Candidatus Fonsibacter sp.]